MFEQREDDATPGARSKAHSKSDPIAAADLHYFCGDCRAPICTAAHEINVKGLFSHTFVNPQGFVYTLGCFSEAPGCHCTGAPSDEFSWFAGMDWRIANCTACGEHLGWFFESPNRAFWGLILNRLIRTDSG
jgi:hypothetical protein